MAVKRLVRREDGFTPKRVGTMYRGVVPTSVFIKEFCCCPRLLKPGDVAIARIKYGFGARRRPGANGRTVSSSSSPAGRRVHWFIFVGGILFVGMKYEMGDNML